MAVFFKTITFRFINRMFGVNSTLVVAVALSCPIVYHPMDHSTPGFPFLHHLLEFAQTLVHWVSNAIQASQPVTPLSSCPQSFWASDFFFFFFFKYQVFTSGGQNIGMSASASVLPMNIQGWFTLGLTSLNPLKSKGLSRVFSSTTVQKHQFFGAQTSLWSNSHIHTWLLEKP